MCIADDRVDLGCVWTKAEESGGATPTFPGTDWESKKASVGFAWRVPGGDWGVVM